ncbi:MAG: NAD(P)/FAD-dependent oxidoreductase [Blautia marasmi]
MCKEKVLIIGAGVAGMEAARVLKLRGHLPVILEKSSRPGGSLHLAGAPSFKHDDLKLVDWYQRTLEDLGVEIHYNTAVTADTLKSYPHDTVIVATGSTPRTLRLPGNHDMYPAERIFSGEITPGDHTVIIGGGLVGCELALDLAKNNRQVTILEALPEILSAGAPVPHMNKIMLKDLLKFHHVQQIAGAGVKCIEDRTVTYTKDGEEHTLEADTFVCAIGYTSNNALYEQLSLEENEIYLLGMPGECGTSCTQSGMPTNWRAVCKGKEGYYMDTILYAWEGPCLSRLLRPGSAPGSEAGGNAWRS